jgi:hypothetical protein
MAAELSMCKLRATPAEVDIIGNKIDRKSSNLLQCDRMFTFEVWQRSRVYRLQSNVLIQVS